jgi:hypothetical protein
MPFKLTKFPGVEDQLRALAKRAAALGISESFLQAIARIEKNLTTRPVEWGDPEYRLKHEGAIACHGIEASLLVRYCVYENERIVCIVSIEPLSDSPLAGP